MAVCNKQHFNKKGNGKKGMVILEQVPCYYIAGVCIVDPIHEGGLTQFLKWRYPYYHSPLYVESKKMQNGIVPNNIVAAHISLNWSPS